MVAASLSSLGEELIFVTARVRDAGVASVLSRGRNEGAKALDHPEGGDSAGCGLNDWVVCPQPVLHGTPRLVICSCVWCRTSKS